MIISLKKALKLKLDYVLLAVIMLVFYGRGQWNNFAGDPDAFYHAKIASFINQGKIIQTLPWMQFSNLRDSFTDHQLLYHVILAPFTNIVNPMIGVKVATVLLTVTMILIFYWLLKKLQIRYPLAFAMGFLIVGGLNFRLFLVKVNSLSLIIVWLLIYALVEKKYILLALLGFVFVWSYGMWPLVFVIFFTYLMAEKIHNYVQTSKIKHHANLKMFLYLSSGVLAGIIINPYWPQNLNFYKELIFIGLLNNDRAFPVGGEWTGANAGEIISSAPHVFIIAAVTIILLIFNRKRIRKMTWFSFLLTVLFFLATLKSRRHVEYYSAFAILFCASGVNDLLSFINKDKIIYWYTKISKPLKVYIITILTVFTILVLPSVYDKVLNPTIHTRYSLDHFQEASLWLKNNTEEESIVFHSDWDEWPILFYNNDHNYYLVGLDPMLIESYDPTLHELYREIAYGNISYDLSEYISHTFKASYVFIDKVGHERFIQNLIADPQFTEVYRDDKTIIYKIIE